jgi:hypothetical protein
MRKKQPRHEGFATFKCENGETIKIEITKEDDFTPFYTKRENIFCSLKEVIWWLATKMAWDKNTKAIEEIEYQIKEVHD